MTTRPASPIPFEPTGLVIDVLAADASATEGVPGWIKLTPRGKFTTRDGRTFEVDPEALAARFASDAIDIPIDIDHSTQRSVFGEQAPAVGWIKELSARPDGTYGRAEWLDAGRAVLKARTHRYVSPVLAGQTDSDRRVKWLHSAALVAAPALSMAALATAEPATTQKEPTMLKKIAAALGLAETADEAACLAAVATLTTGRVDKAVHDQTVASLSAATAKLAQLEKTGRDKAVKDLLDGALAAKKIVPAQRAHFETLCATDDGLKGVTDLIAAMAPTLGASGLDDKKPADQVATLSAEDREVMQMLGLTEEQYRKANGLAAA